MNYLFYIAVLFLPFLVCAQNEEAQTDSLSTLNPYIQDHSNQLNMNLDVTNEQINYFKPYQDKKAQIRSNLNVSYGVVINYRFLSVRLAFRPKLSESELENKGKTDRFRLRVKLLFDKWTHRIEYNYTRGFYIENTDEFDIDLINPSYKIQFPNLTINVLSGSSHYKFNDNYSVKAIESNTEIQLRSAGTLLVGADYAIYFLTGTNVVKLENQVVIDRDSFNEYYGFSPVFNAGYYYTYVFRKYWYANANAAPGLGIDFYHAKFYSNEEYTSSHNTSVFFAFRTGISAGFNGEKIYFGGAYNYEISSQKYNIENVVLQPLKNNFHLFLGYRFRAPKQLRKPVDYIEKKVPVLKTDGNK